MASFDLAIPITLSNEGGDKFTEDKRDLGGATKYGISLRFYKEEVSKDATAQTIKEISEDEAKSIYKKFFWDENNYSLITNQSIASKIFDMSVCMGVGTSNKIAQCALRAVNGSGGTIEDGVIGPHTISCINSTSTDRMSYMSALKEGYACHFRNIAKFNPSQECFMKGWLNRAYS